jgi:pyridoxine kinase
VPQADVLTPNQFELGVLTGLPVDTLGGAAEAANLLRRRLRPAGPRVVLVTSLRTAATPPEQAQMLLAAQGGMWLVTTPLLPARFNGAGDLLAALFLFHIVSSGDAVWAAERAAASLIGVLRATWRAAAAELQIVAAQDELVRPAVAVPDVAVTVLNLDAR